MTSPPRILVADDQAAILEALSLMLRANDYAVTAVPSPRRALEAVQSAAFDCVLLDLNYTRDTTSGQEGLELIEAIQAADPLLPIVVMTAFGSVDTAVAAMSRGARDYVEKPWNNTRLLATLNTQVELSRALKAGERLERELRLLDKDGAPEMIATAPAMRPLLDLLQRIGPSDANVLVTGEHGTGKELVARWLHAASPRVSRPLVVVNMGGLAEGVFESEMFGHVKGAFTGARVDRPGRFELADGGTLFLDEIANVPLALQSKLLRVLQSGEFERVGSSRTQRADVRLICATNADLQAEVEAGRFREDLRFRINTVEAVVPPLRERREDISLLASHFLQRHAARYRKPARGFERGAMAQLLDYPWPGNVRELDHVVERAVLMSSGAEILPTDLGLAAAPGRRLEDMTLEEVERVLIEKALRRHQGNVSEAAKTLGLSRSALYRRLGHHGV